MDLKEEEILGEAINSHWYYCAKAQVLNAAVKEPVGEVLDVGAGSGWFSKWLLKNGKADRAVCVDLGYDADRDEEVAGKPVSFRRQVDQSTADLGIMMDVLEHVEDDVGLLSFYLDLVPEGTPFFITVPAFQFLWSAHDVFLGHYRRYTLKSLRKTIEGAGAKVERMHYYYGAVLPLAAGVRLVRRKDTKAGSDLSVQSPPVNAVLKAICAAERWVMRGNKLGGLSVVCVCSR